MMITSTQNPKIQWLRKLQSQASERKKEGAFVVEGVRLAEEALASDWPARLVIFSEGLSERGQAAAAAFHARGAAMEQVSTGVLEAASDTRTPQGLVIALERRELALPANPDFLFIPDQVRDPGNLGTMLRSAAAAGVQAVLLPAKTTDAFAPKTLRAGMGAQFRLPILSLELSEIRQVLEGMQVCLAASSEGKVYTEVDFRLATALLIGSEADGVSPELAELATDAMHIPMPGGGESLNAAVAAGILLFEAARQRSIPGPA